MNMKTKSIIITLLLILSLSIVINAEDSFRLHNLKGEIDLENDRLITIYWNNDKNLIEKISSGKIKDAKIEFNIKLDQGKYLDERNLPLFETNAMSLSYTFDPFVNRPELNTDNTLVQIKMRYKYMLDDKEVIGDYSDSLTLGHDSFIKNTSFWSKDQIEKASKLGIILESMKEDVRKPITRYEFIKMLMKMDQYIAKHDVEIIKKFEDIADYDINFAYNIGIVNGVKDGVFGGDNTLTKEEMATILSRYLVKLGRDITHSDKNIADIDKVSKWALDSIKHLLDIGVIVGDDHGMINSQNEVTREEAIVMVIRIFDIVV